MDQSFVLFTSIVVAVISAVVLVVGLTRHFVSTGYMQREAELTSQIKVLERLVATDPLTGLLNRRYLKERLDQFVDLLQHSSGSRRKATLQAFAVLMIDIDYFKRTNDQYGHVAGDQVLQKVASTIQHSIRRSDVAFRYGGEEFAVLLPNAFTEEATLVAEKIRTEVEQLKFTEPGLAATVSVGGFCTRAKIEPKTLIERADKNLYTAKRNGRNRVVVM